MERMQIYK